MSSVKKLYLDAKAANDAFSIAAGTGASMMQRASFSKLEAEAERTRIALNSELERYHRVSLDQLLALG